MTLVLDLGKQPLANNFVSEPCEQPTYPLILSRCKECFHTQQDFTVPPEQMFSTYQYISGTSKTLCRYFSWLSEHIIKEYPITNRKRIVMELACNDGSQLDEFKKRGWDTIGVDPAKNIGEIAKSKGHDIHVAFWGSEKVSINTLPDVIIAQNVLAHVPDPVLFMKACHNYMANHSSLYIQTSQCNMYENGEFDTIYHEHLSFFTVSSMRRLAKETGLIITHVEKTPIHGTSYLFTLKRNDADEYLQIDSTVEELIKYETPFYQDSFFNTYKQRIYNVQKWVQQISKEFIEKNYTLIAFGAAAKGMTLLNFFSINQYITYIVDDAYMKQGKYTPNSNIIIRHPSVLKDDTRKIAVIILAWNFMDEISLKISEWRKNKNTVLIIPYPQQIIRYLF
jgi:2-polyprenyl-3-methyl-5-hydroxy-6-metoxy-1,4-benzoquinol methylase